MKYEFKVEGLMCEKCVARLQNVLSADENISTAVVSLESKTATVDATCDADAVKTLIEDAGFDVI